MRFFVVCLLTVFLFAKGAIAAESTPQAQQATAQQATSPSAVPPVTAGAATGNPDEVSGSGVVRHVRENPVPQVFFNELNGAFLIQDGQEYANFYNVLTSSMRTKKPVQFVYNKKTMKIVSVVGAFSRNTQVYEDAPLEPEEEKKDSDKKEGSSAKPGPQTPTEQKQSIDEFLKSMDKPKK